MSGTERKASGNKPVTILVPDELREEIRQLAAQTDRRESAMIRRMLAKALELYKAGEWKGE